MPHPWLHGSPASGQFTQNGAIMSAESLGGKELDWYFRFINEGVEAISPSPRLFVTQIGLEPVLRARAEALGARLEYGTELSSFEADDDGVTAVVKTIFPTLADVQRAARS